MNGEERDRLRTRRMMAQASMLLTWVITIAFIAGLFDNDVAARVAMVWPPFSVLFPSLMAYIGWYAKLGSDEMRHEMTLNQGDDKC